MWNVRKHMMSKHIQDKKHSPCHFYNYNCVYVYTVYILYTVYTAHTQIPQQWSRMKVCTSYVQYHVETRSIPVNRCHCVNYVDQQRYTMLRYATQLST